MIPRLKADLRIRDLLALAPRDGDDIAAFETAFAALAGQKHALAFPYGRTAQLAILRILGLRDNGRNEVICPAYTCVVVPHAIVAAGLEPVFVDCAIDGTNMDWQFLEQATTDKTGAVIMTSLFGQPIDMQALDAYRARHPGVYVLQDCAHSFFADDGARFVQQQGLAAFYGLNISKIMTSIFGGMVTSDDDEFMRILRIERDNILKPASGFKSLRRSLYLVAATAAFLPPVYTIVNWLERSGMLNHFVKYYDPGIIDMPRDAFEDMCPIEARIGQIQCRRYHDIVNHRRKLAALYWQELQNTPNVILPAWQRGATWSHFVVRSARAKGIMDHCLRHGVQLGELIEYNIPDMPAYAHARYVGEKRSRAIPGTMLNLPVHMGVSEDAARHIARLILDIV